MDQKSSLTRDKAGKRRQIQITTGSEKLQLVEIDMPTNLKLLPRTTFDILKQFQFSFLCFRANEIQRPRETLEQYL